MQTDHTIIAEKEPDEDKAKVDISWIKEKPMNISDEDWEIQKPFWIEYYNIQVDKTMTWDEKVELLNDVCQRMNQKTREIIKLKNGHNLQT